MLSTHINSNRAHGGIGDDNSTRLKQFNTSAELIEMIQIKRHFELGLLIQKISRRFKASHLLYNEQTNLEVPKSERLENRKVGLTGAVAA